MSAREHQLHGRKQSFHQPRFFHEDSHEDKQRHGSQGLFQHDPRELVGHQVEHQLAESEIAEDQPKEYQGKRDREADKNREQHAADQDQAEDFVGHWPGQRLWVAA